MIKDRTWAEVNLDNIAFNYNSFKRLVGSGTSGGAEVMCVIKADGYGHGAVALGLHLQKCGCGFFAVATLSEALELCRAGITVPVLVLNYIHPARISEALEYPNIRLTLIDLDSARALSRAVAEAGGSKAAHVKLDTGMTRVGFNTDTAASAIEKIRELPGVELEGVFTHFAVADETDSAYTEQQFERYMRIVSVAGDIPFKHVCNSAAAIMYPEMRLDMVRLGISLYGCYPSEYVDKSRVELKPAMQLKTRVIRVNDVEPGVSVSYGRKFTTERRSRLATIPIGYADGLSRTMSRGLANGLTVLINGQEAPVVGRICMDQSIVDITDIGEVRVLDEVVVYGDGLPVERAAEPMGTINYEVLCMVGRRAPRVYTEKGTVTKVIDYLEVT